MSLVASLAIVVKEWFIAFAAFRQTEEKFGFITSNAGQLCNLVLHLDFLLIVVVVGKKVRK